MSRIILPTKLKTDNKSDVKTLHSALRTLNLPIAEKAVSEKKVEASTKAAIKKIQKEYKLPQDGKLTEKTITAINDEINHRFITENKYRTSGLQTDLQKLNFKIDKAEEERRVAGDSTLKAIKEFQKKEGLPVTGKLTGDVVNRLNEAVIKEKLKTKTQKSNLQYKLQHVGRIANLNVSISDNELKDKNLGTTSKNLIKAFQQKYNLPATGEINKATLDKIDSVAASKGKAVKHIRPAPVEKLSAVTKNLRLNMVSPQVAEMQKSLSFLGYKISEKEFNSQAFGKTTIKAIRTFQDRNGLPQTGHFDKATSDKMNNMILTANPDAGPGQKYHIRGSVRDELWQRKNNMVIKVFEKVLDQVSNVPLAAKKTFLNGFFDLVYQPPVNPVDGKVKSSFHLVVRLYDASDQQNPVASQTHYNVNPIHWVNFTAVKNEDGSITYDGKYAGNSEFEVTGPVILKAIGNKKVEDLKETAVDRQISQLSIQTGLSTDEIMCHVLSALVSKSVNEPATLTPEVFYGFIRQGFPADLPGDLLRGASEWDTIDQLTELTASGIVFLQDDIQAFATDNAIAQNLVSQKIKLDKANIVQKLQDQRKQFVLQKPILTGNQNLQSLLEKSKISAANYPLVASVFISNNGVNPSFWEEIRTNEAAIGKAAVQDFITTVETGNITKNHLPTLTFFKSKIGTGPGKPFKKASDIAKLDKAGLIDLINQNGKKVPDNMPGDTIDEKVGNYAAAMKQRAGFLFPAVSLVATVKASNTQKITKIANIESFIDEQEELDFRQQNLDKYLQEKNINLDPKTLEELKVVQRVFKITPHPDTGSVLIDQGLHSSMQIYYTGRDRLDTMLTAKGIEPPKTARVYEAAKLQYMQVLARFIDFRREFNRLTPAAIVPQTYTDEEIQKELGNIPSLESLFGSLDYCECEHCKSLYGPSAYLTDMLRFLNEHDSLVKKNGKTLSVKEILFDRRPDLGNIKLNCENTNTPLPYIDLVCEILENNISPEQKDFSFQTTLTAKELRAIPQYIRPAAYTTLAGADFPMKVSFNLWQEEAQTYLNFLRVPRYGLMEAFQDISDPNAKKPDDATIAAAFFGISSKEKDLIVTKRAAAADQNKYWGFDTTKTDVDVLTFGRSTGLSYYEILELLLVKFVNDPASPQASRIERPNETCDINQQKISKLTPAKFDLMHRFIRLWRKTGWKMWELDLLIRNPKTGNNAINGSLLVNLKLFRQLQDTLRLPFEILLAFFGDINREIRITPDNPDVIIQPLYNVLFQNQAVTNPVDPNFKALDNNNKPVALNNVIIFGTNAAAPFNGYSPVPTILSSLALPQTDFDLLAAKTDNHLSVNSLSVLLRYGYLARSLKLTIKELLLLIGITGTADPFADLQVITELIRKYEKIRSSGLSLIQLDYILNFNSGSPAGLRDESIVLLIGALRKILSLNKEKIDQLKLSTASRDSILSFDEDALEAMANPQFTATLTPLKTILSAAVDNFTNASFSVEETNFIIAFDPANPTAAAKSGLKDKIRTLKENLSNLLNQNSNQIKSQIAAAFGLTDEQATTIVENIGIDPGPETLLVKLSDASLIAKNPDGSFSEITRANFPSLFNIHILLHKISLLVSGMKIEPDDLKWFIINHAAVNTPDLAALPVTAPAVPNDFDAWYNLYRFLSFKAGFPEPEGASLRSILDLARDAANPKAAIIDAIAKLTQWENTTITALDAGFKIKHTAGHLDYTDSALYHRFLRCFKQMKLTGADAEVMFKWALITNDPSIDMTVSLQTRQAVKAKYEQDDWLEKITPLYDEIRERKRTALVEYHLENSRRNETETIQFQGKTIPNPLYWEDSNALFKYFLIDVEMNSCQLTSRIKQALSSVQLFVQRCFLNLENRYVTVTQDEKEDTSSPNAWSQWKWMKNYRIWEANRKVFFYPENYLEPELRDDKSPFFEELENELLQNDVTKENVEAAFQNFLHKVDEVSHLEVCGLYHQMEDLDPSETGYEQNIVHVIGRTHSVPNIYYYRKYDMNYNSWSAWEKIDIDITGEQVTPVVYNRKLHLFWLQFSEKPMKARKVPAAQASTGPSDAPEPMKVLEVQLGWTIKKSGGWSPKKISKEKLIHPWERPHYSYNLKPYYLSKYNELYLDIYLSTSREFNDSLFYDPNKKLNPNASNSTLRNPTYITKNRFDETYLPWHSSSFIFNGDVKDVKLKGLGGLFSLDIPIIGNIEYWAVYDSYDYVHRNFGSDGAKIKELVPALEYGPRLKLPNGMHYSYTHLTNNKVTSKNNNHLTILQQGGTVGLLNGAISPFELVITQQELQLNGYYDHPMFYQDRERAFFIKPEWQTVLNSYGQVLSKNRKYRFLPFYHPYTVLFLRELNRSGIDGLMKRSVQTKPQTYPPQNNFNFNTYSPSAATIADDTSAADRVDFTFSGAFSIYNWELFFHAPLMIACRLMQNQKFEDALTWFHYIFDPTNIENFPTPQRYWITRPFFEYNSEEYRKQRIESILSNLNEKKNADQLRAWRNFPFKPHVIARYRPVAYQKNVVMKYLDNLVAWGDMLFKRDTIESINEASLLYMLAYEILGRRPGKVPDVAHEELTFKDIEDKLDQFGNARVDVLIEDTLLPVTVIPSGENTEPVPKIETFYFCIPNNDDLEKYWDVVEDRLFKIRNCMNIEGIVRQLPLFEPPIDPRLLVKAAAAGIDFGSVLNDLNAPTPYYRFKIVQQKAIEFCAQVNLLGEKLLTALEKKDAETLSLLKSQNEIQLLEAVREVNKRQVDEAAETIKGLEKASELALEKKNYYESQSFMNTAETIGLTLTSASTAIDAAVAAGYIIAGGLKAIPQFIAGGSGFGGSPVVTIDIGGKQFGDAAEIAVKTLSSISHALEKGAAIANTLGSYYHRKDEWDFQGRLATIEKSQVDVQIKTAEIRLAIAGKELERQEIQIENSKSEYDFLRNKFTNEQLFVWMVSQVSTVYFQAYQLAYDMAKKAEKCYQYELGIPDSNIIQFGYWDSLKKGLLAGDKLHHDLQRLEAEYLNQNKREFEITKNISLLQVAPLSLITLKETGQCKVSIPELLFDMDFPGHYMRRIKNVSVSIPCVIGPYAGVNCTLSLLRNETRMDSTLSGGKYEKLEDDSRFRTMFGTISSIATSHAQNDAGMFELNFNDDRYLPFEGAGVISDWQINMPKENNSFDFSTLSDVILHIRYTSRNGGGQFATAAGTYTNTQLPDKSARLFSLKHEFPSEWYRFLNPENGNDQQFRVTLKTEHYPFFLRGRLGNLRITKMDMFVETIVEGNFGFKTDLKITSGNSSNDVAVNRDAVFDNVHHLEQQFAQGNSPAPLGEISMKLKLAAVNDFKSLTSDQVSNVFLLLRLGK